VAFFEGKEMTGGYGGPDIITSCSLNVNRGEIVAILGPNGAGKSTAMKAMLGLLNLNQEQSQLMAKIFQIYLPKIELNKAFLSFHKLEMFLPD